MKRIVPFVLLVSLLFVSCKSVETVYVEPEPLDIGPSIQLLFDAKPDDSKLVIKSSPETVYDILENSNVYLTAWENWKTYSEALESYLEKLRETLVSS